MPSSWIDKMAGESRWLRASQLEKEERYEEALKLYLEEAEEQEERSLALSALSFLSAAKCAVKLGRLDEARKYFEEAGARYEKYADSIISISPNSSAWAYKMASRCYNWAGKDREADNILRKSESLREKLGEEGEKHLPLFKPYKPRREESEKKI